MNIMLIDENGKVIGSVSFDVAGKMAKQAGKDLIMVNAKENIYRLADAGKLKYEQKQKERQQRAQKRTHKIKEIQISPNIDSHDLNTKLIQIKAFLEKGMKTKITMILKGRQQAFKELAIEKLKYVISVPISENLGTLDGQIKTEGRNLIAYIAPKS